VSTAAYYLGRALVAQGLRVLLADLSQRQSPLATLSQHHPVRNLVPWTPAPIPAGQLPRAIQAVQRSVAGRADVILLDIDATLLLAGGTFAAGIDYVAVVAENSPEGRAGADRLVSRLREGTPGSDQLGVVLSRVESPAEETLPRRLDSGVPVIGWLPADYRLAAGEAYSLKGGSPATPHDAYLHAVTRLAQSLTRLVPLRRLGAATVLPASHSHPSEQSQQGHPATA
jgi:hypothetical protein